MVGSVQQPGQEAQEALDGYRYGREDRISQAPDRRGRSAAYCKEITKGVKDGKPCSDYAILYRTNTQSRTIEEALRREGLPYIIVGGTKFYDRKEVKDLITYLKVLSNNKDSVSLKRIVNTPPRGIGEAAMKKAAEIASPDNLPLLECLARLSEDPSMAAGPRRRISEFLALLDGLMELKDSLPPSRLAEKLLIDIKYREYLKESLGIEAQGKIDNIKELISSIKEYEKAAENPTRGIPCAGVPAHRLGYQEDWRARGNAYDPAPLKGP
jgi:DNA helicase-2/ATP-dependent DNA helicase PcrA